MRGRLRPVPAGPALGRRARRARRRGATGRRLIGQLGPARWPRSRSAACSSAGPAATPSPARPGGARRRCAGPPTGPRRRWPGWSGRSAATCSSSSRSGPRAARGTASRAPPSSSTGTTCCTAPASASRRCGSRRPTSSSPSSSGRSKGWATRRGSARSPTARSLWAGLFDLRENLLGAHVDDLRARRVARRGGAPTIAVVGSVNLDLVARCERLPRPGETVTGATFERVPGGKGREPGASRQPGSGP